MSRTGPPTEPHDVRASATELQVPRQRPPRHGVSLVLTPAEPLTRVVPRAARAAKQQDSPLLIVMLSSGTHVGAPCMAALDSALQLIRAASPGLVVRVYTLSPHEIAAHLAPDGLVVASPRTWSRLPENVRAAHPPGPRLELVEPAD